jgi:hypothetical protein
MALTGPDDQGLSLAYRNTGAIVVVNEYLALQHHVHFVLGMLVESVAALETTQVGAIVINLSE